MLGSKKYKNVLSNWSKKILYIQVHQKSATKLILQLQTLFLNYIIYANAQACEEPRQTFETKISTNTAKDVGSLTSLPKKLHPRNLAGFLIYVIK